jgi:hypothetical protein
LAANQRHYPIGLYTGTLNAHADSGSQMTSLSWRLWAGQRAYESDCWALKVQCGCAVDILGTATNGKCLQLRAPFLGFLVWTKKAMRSDRGGNAEAHGNTIQYNQTVKVATSYNARTQDIDVKAGSADSDNAKGFHLSCVLVEQLTT